MTKKKEEKQYILIEMGDETIHRIGNKEEITKAVEEWAEQSDHAPEIVENFKVLEISKECCVKLILPGTKITW